MGLLACTPSLEREQLLHIESIVDHHADSAMKYQDGYLYYDAKRLDGTGYLAKGNYKAGLPIFQMICEADMGTTRDSAYLSFAYAGVGDCGDCSCCFIDCVGNKAFYSPST